MEGSIQGCILEPSNWKTKTRLRLWSNNKHTLFLENIPILITVSTLSKVLNVFYINMIINRAHLHFFWLVPFIRFALSNMSHLDGHLVYYYYILFLIRDIPKQIISSNDKQVERLEKKKICEPDYWLKFTVSSGATGQIFIYGIFLVLFYSIHYFFYNVEQVIFQYESNPVTDLFYKCISYISILENFSLVYILSLFYLQIFWSLYLISRMLYLNKLFKWSINLILTCNIWSSKIFSQYSILSFI